MVRNHTMGKLSIAFTITNNGVFGDGRLCSTSYGLRSGGAIAQPPTPTTWYDDETALVDLTITTSTLSNNGAARVAQSSETGNIRIALVQYTITQ